MERVLMLTGDAGEELEAYYLLYRLREAGYAVDVAAPSRKVLQLVVHDFEAGNDAYVERPGRGLQADLAFADVDPERYVGLLIPGGRAPEYIRADADVKRIVSQFFDNDLPVGHMCHGAQVPAAYGYLRGRRCSAFPPLAPDVEAAGGTFVEGPDVVDGNMVSATGWPDLAEFSKAFLALLTERAGERVAGAVDDGLAVGR
jgi:protease I